MSIQTKTMTVKSDTSLAETTTTIRDTVTFDVSNMPNGITYKGLKAVLSFADPIQWNKASTYDALTVVWDDASHGSYASKRPVPANIELTNEFYWLRTADLDAQVEIYRQEVRELDGRVTANAVAIDNEIKRAKEAEKAIDSLCLKSYDTVSAMVSDTSLSLNNYIKTLGFHALGDNGGAYYKIKDSETANGTTVIALDNGLFAVLQNKSVTLEQLGAYGDGSTDDTAAILASTGFKNVEVTAGKTFIANVGSTPIIYRDTNMFGNGTLKLSGVSNYAPNDKLSIISHVIFYGMNGRTVRDVKFQDGDVCDKCVTFYGCTDCVIDGITSINNHSGWNVCIWNCNRFVISGSKIISNGARLYNDALHIASSNVIAYGNYCYSEGDDSIAIGYNPKNQHAGMYPIANEKISNVIIANNISFSVGSRAASVFNFNNEVEIENVEICNNILKGIVAFVPGNTAEPGSRATDKSVQFIGNTIDVSDCNTSGPLIHVINCDRVIIKNNAGAIDNARYNAAIFINNVNNAQVSDNFFKCAIDAPCNGVNLIKLGTQTEATLSNEINIVNNVFEGFTEAIYQDNQSVKTLNIKGNKTNANHMYNAYTNSTVDNFFFIENICLGKYGLNPYNIYIPKHVFNYMITNNYYSDTLSEYTDEGLIMTTNYKINKTTGV